MTPERLPVLSPNTGRRFGWWRPTPAAALAGALEAADSLIDRPEPPEARAARLNGMADAVMARAAALADMVVREVGKTPAEAAAEVEYAASFLRDAAAATERIEFESRTASGRRVRETAPGAALLIAPFNDPLAGIARKVGPALAAGAPALVKPSRLGALSAGLFLEALRDGGAGDRTQLVAPAENGAVSALVRDPRVGVVSFTGSTKTGRALAVEAARAGAKGVFELGGNCPFVICADADAERAVADLVARKIRAAGQACSAANRAFVAAEIWPEVRERLLEAVRRLRTGPSDAAGVDYGPVRTAEAVARLAALVERAERGGEKLLTARPASPPPDSPFLAPLSVLECVDGSAFDATESFGPALSIRPFRCLDALLPRLERERHALAAYFYAGEPEALLPRLRRLRFGSIGLNSTAIQATDAPTGGFRDAGVGREGGAWGVREFLAPINHRIGAPARRKGGAS